MTYYVSSGTLNLTKPKPLPRSSETAEQRPISQRTRSQRRRSAETNEQTAARLSARRDRDSQRRRSGDYFEVEGRYFPQV